MQIGILTWYYGDNYGAKAHSYALQNILSSWGHDVEMIACFPHRLRRINLRMNLNSSKRFVSLSKLIDGIKRCKKFKTWTTTKYTQSGKVNNINDIDQMKYDMIIVGSDEVYNYNHPFFIPVYYGVGIKRTPIITYAVSSGQADSKVNLQAEYQAALNGIRAFSVRDEHTKELIEYNTEAEAKIVLDPTLLYDFEEYIINVSGEYLLIYSFDEWNELKDNVQKFAQKHGLKIVCVGRKCKWADISLSDATELEWLGCFVGAKYVLTDSFHGLIFSIKNHKQPIILSRHDKINKINDLINLLNINRKFYDISMDIEDYLSNEIDYNQVDSRIHELADISIEFLKEHLSD